MKIQLHSKLKSLIYKQDGFALVSFVILLPLLLTIFVAIFAAFYIMKNESETRQICRTSALSMQESVTADLNALIKMNLGAKFLRLTRKVADNAVVVSAAYPPAEAVAQAFKEAVIAAQTLYSYSQNAIILKAEATQYLAHAQIQSNIHTALMRAEKIQSEGVKPKFFRSLDLPLIASEVSVNWPKFNVEASPKDSLTPDYKPADDFAKDAEIHVKWKLNLSRLLPKWMQKILERTGMSPNIRLNLACGASAFDTSDESANSSENNSELNLKNGGNSSGVKGAEVSTENADSIFQKAKGYLAKQIGGGKWVGRLNADK